MVAAVGIDFAEVKYLDGTFLRFTRVPHATRDGAGEAPPATGAVDETDAHELSVNRREIA